MYKPLIIANWKANPSTIREAVLLSRKIERGISRLRKVETVIAPPHTFISDVGEGLKKAKLGAQDCFYASGPYTGEVAPAQLKKMGVEYVIVGHSERKLYLGESEGLINKKIKAILAEGLKPILCVGEKERIGNEIPKIISEQLKQNLKGVGSGDVKNIVVAYEPIWAISTMPGARPDTPDNAFRAMLYIRRVLTELFGRNAAGAVRIIYGGSVKSFNIVSFIKEGRAEGALVGGASLNPEEFIKIVSEANRLK